MKILRISAVLAVVACLSGCAIWDYTISVRCLEKAKAKYSKTFEKDPSYCYEKTLEKLDQWKAVIFQKRADKYIAAWGFNNVYKSCINTTELGIFFSRPEPNRTQVEVSSNNSRLSAYVSEKLFEYIENPQSIEEAEQSPAPKPQ